MIRRHLHTFQVCGGAVHALELLLPRSRDALNPKLSAHLVRACPGKALAVSERRRARGLHLPSEPSTALGRAPEVGTTVNRVPLILDP